MKLRALGAASLVLLLAAGTAAENPAKVAPTASVYGRWYFPKAEKLGLSQVFSIDLWPGKIQMSNHCSYEGHSVVTELQAPARIDGGRIEVLGAGRQKNAFADGLFECRAALERGSLEFELAEGALLVTDPGTGRRTRLTREAP